MRVADRSMALSWLSQLPELSPAAWRFGGHIQDCGDIQNPDPARQHRLSVTVYAPPAAPLTALLLIRGTAGQVAQADFLETSAAQGIPVPSPVAICAGRRVHFGPGGGVEGVEAARARRDASRLRLALA